MTDVANPLRNAEQFESTPHAEASPSAPKGMERATRSQRTVRFRQADVARALRGAKDAGLEVARFEIEPVGGKIVVYISSADSNKPEIDKFAVWKAKREALEAAEQANEYATWKAKYVARQKPDAPSDHRKDQKTKSPSSSRRRRSP